MADVAIASVGCLGIRREESFASGGDVNEYQPIISEALNPVKEYFRPANIQCSRQQAGGRLIGESIAGPVNFYVTPANIQTWWRVGLGGSASPYTSKGTTTLESMVVQVDRVKREIYTSGDMITSLEFTASNTDGLQCTANIEGQGFSIAATPLSATFNSGDEPYMLSEATILVGGVEDAEITGFSISLNNNNITDLRTGNSLVRREIPPTSTTVTGTFTRLYTDTTASDLFLGNAETSFKATFVRGSNSFALECPRVDFETDEHPLAGFSEVVIQTVSFTAFVDDPAFDDMFKITVV